MNKKLQALIEEFSRDLSERAPGVSLEIYPRRPKQAYVYVLPAEGSAWDGEAVWDLLDSMAQKESDTLVETGYHIVLLPRFRHPPAVNVAALRERAAVWRTSEEEDTQSTG
jgi:hypothetical protein